MPFRRPTSAAPLAALIALAGCGLLPDSVSDSVPEVRFGVLEPSREPEPEPAAIRPEAELERRPVARVTDLEIGVTRSGRLLKATGEAPLTGWFQPALRPRRDGAPGPDGFLDFDLVAAPPELNGGPAGVAGTPAQRRVQAVRLLTADTLAGAAGLRVHAAEGPPAAIRFTAP